MASKQTYPCYVCKKNGFEDVRVYLDGKTADGKTIYKNEDMSPRIHKQHAPKFRQRVNSNTSSMQDLNRSCCSVIGVAESYLCFIVGPTATRKT